MVMRIGVTPPAWVPAYPRRMPGPAGASRLAMKVDSWPTDVAGALVTDCSDGSLQEAACLHCECEAGRWGGHTSWPAAFGGAGADKEVRWLGAARPVASFVCAGFSVWKARPCSQLGGAWHCSLLLLGNVQGELLEAWSHSESPSAAASCGDGHWACGLWTWAALGPGDRDVGSLCG